MRDFAELNINDGGKPVARPAPSAAAVRAFEQAFAVELPRAYLALLRAANGGSPEVDTIAPNGEKQPERWSVNRFYHLDDDRSSPASLWKAMERWRPVLGARAIPFANDGGDNQFFLDLTMSPPPVKVCIHDEELRSVLLAPSFEAFIDALYVDPDMI
jgi:hypothetical protein